VSAIGHMQPGTFSGESRGVPTSCGSHATQQRATVVRLQRLPSAQPDWGTKNKACLSVNNWSSSYRAYIVREQVVVLVALNSGDVRDAATLLRNRRFLQGNLATTITYVTRP
jgi:hypothetical protein